VHQKILRAQETRLKRDALEAKVSVLQGQLDSDDVGGRRRLLAEWLPEYAPASDTVGRGMGEQVPRLFWRDCRSTPSGLSV